MKRNIIKTLAIVNLFTLVACKNEVKNEEVEGKTKKETISFAPKVTGRILKIYVEEGEIIHAGDTLALLDVPEVSAKIAQAKGATAAAIAQAEMAKNGATHDQLLQLKAKQKGLSEQFDYAKKSYNRARNMHNDSLMAQQQYDEIFAKYQGAKAQLDAVNAELHDVEIGTRIEKISMAEGQASQAKGALQEANVVYSERYIIATNDIEIETITLNVGELATAGYPLFNGYIPNSTFFRFTVPESKIAQYQKGAKVNMISNYSNQEFTGNIVAIKQLAKYADITTAYPDYEPGEAVYEIKVIPTDRAKLNNLLVNSRVTLK
ncbi:biotin/lipoyl-binding protein [Flavobacterium oreochromis]|uniref:HlyD family secretion protein n=1 Tax=Flavobacterium oreochromis TaxID=2906078 RepID=UPI00385F5D0E